jgi:hypothetical protein
VAESIASANAFHARATPTSTHDRSKALGDPN